MAYRTTPAVAARLAENRARILRAVLQCVAAGGWPAVVIADVAEIAGVSVGSIYRYFPSKGELLAEAYALQTGRESEVVAEVAVAELDPVDRLSTAITLFATRAMKRPRLAYAMLAEPAAPEVEAMRLEYHAAFVNIFATIVQAGVDSGDFLAERADVCAACIVGAMCEALIGPLAPLQRRHSRSREQLVQALLTFCLRAVLHPSRQQLLLPSRTEGQAA